MRPPRHPQTSFKSPPRGPQSLPRGSTWPKIGPVVKDRSKRPPRGFQEASRGLQEAPKGPQEVSKRLHEPSKRLQKPLKKLQEGF